MTAPIKKTPGRNPGASHSNIQPDQCNTTIRGRRAISHLWTASRAVSSAVLTTDDKALLREALAEIWKAVQP